MSYNTHNMTKFIKSKLANYEASDRSRETQEQLLIDLVSHFDEKAYSRGTDVSKRSTVKVALSKLGVDPDLVLKITPTRDEYKAQNTASSERLVGREEEKFTYSMFVKLMQHPAAEVLIRCGLRYSEMLEKDYEVKGDEIYFKLSKGQNDDRFYKTFIIGDLDKFVSDLERVRQTYSDKRELRKQLSEIVAGFGFKIAGKATHICRALCFQIFYDCLNPMNKTKAFFSRKILHHDNPQSAMSYNYLKISEADCKKMLRDLIFTPDAGKFKCFLCKTSVKDKNKHIKTTRHKTNILRMIE